MYRALLAADGNVERVLGQARAIRALPNAPETVSAVVLHVFDDSAVDERSEMVDPERVTAVTEAVALLEDAGVSVETRGAAGDTAETVIRIAEEIDADGVFVGGPKRSPAGKAIFGSTTQEIILNAARPVTVTIDR